MSLIQYHLPVERNGRALQPMSPTSYSSSIELTWFIMNLENISLLPCESSSVGMAIQVQLPALLSNLLAKASKYNSAVVIKNRHLLNFYAKCFRGKKAVEAEHLRVREHFFMTYGKHCQNVDRHSFGLDSDFLRQLFFFFNPQKRYMH
ncbi:E3 ubiquitin-protein ligase UPL6 [Camellia lanceoleosa]|uniref:E3 ubiquitin-protein ligase UPL6 n=1 Tax=Camellia lanceoleosa TaxID=1840588 RepID=A0ACC0IR53_9ERIC|nr:E3 ubiquitin-protein ligase UPL6 [Camellia lanceoleosa]